MKIEKLQTDTHGDRKRATATIVWEDCDRGTEVISFETVGQFGDALSANPHAFLAGSIVPAMHLGEKRITVDGDVCPEFLGGLEVVTTWLWHWYYRGRRPRIVIEGKTNRYVGLGRSTARTAVFFSGGVDSLAVIRKNRRRFAPDHPASMKDGLCVFGFEQSDPKRFEYVLSALSRIADDAGITLIPAYTNVYLNHRAQDARDDFRLWALQFQGAALAATAHAFVPRISRIYVGATDAISDLALSQRSQIRPFGTHPLIDPYYSSSDLRVHHDGIELSRLDKVRLLADWPVALENLRVCNRFLSYEPGRLNCGKCEKCVRTMLELLVLGKLREAKAFPFDDVTPDLVEKAVRLIPRAGREYDAEVKYLELLAPLRHRGRSDLARILEHKIRVSNIRRSLEKKLRVSGAHRFLERKIRVSGARRFLRRWLGTRST